MSNDDSTKPGTRQPLPASILDNLPDASLNPRSSMTELLTQCCRDGYDLACRQMLVALANERRWHTSDGIADAMVARIQELREVNKRGGVKS